MATKTFIMPYTKDPGDGTAPTFVTGASGKVRIWRVSDYYEWDTGTSTFVAAAATAPTLSESATGVYSATVTTTTWTNGTYYAWIEVHKTGESPYSTSEDFLITDGVASTSTPSPPASGDYCRVYIYWLEKPSTTPTVVAQYISQVSQDSASLPAVAITGTYSSATGLHYWDVLRGTVAEITCVARGVRRTFVTPRQATAALVLIPEVS